MKDFNISIETVTETRNRLRVKNQSDCQKLVQISVNKEVVRLAILEAGEEYIFQLPEEITDVHDFEVSEVEDEEVD